MCGRVRPALCIRAGAFVTLNAMAARGYRASATWWGLGVGVKGQAGVGAVAWGRGRGECGGGMVVAERGKGRKEKGQG